MGFIDKIKNMMSSDEDFDDFDDFDEDFEEDEDFDEKKPSKFSIFKKKENDADDDDEEPVVKRTAEPKAAPKVGPKITPISKKRGTGVNMEVCVIKPVTNEDGREVIDTLLMGRAVIVNFEGLDRDEAQRIIDYICGACYALNGNLRRISSYIFIVTPESVDISGDIQELFPNAFDAPGVTTDF